ncbi:hypothetical protein [Falsiroseomonas sp.]|uniref:hypothetical protein n=1 Tax=Falsiroseomonas sp. TaxID=2870721 RepID=UPI00356A2171
MRRVPPAWLAFLLPLAAARMAPALELELPQDQLLWIEPHPGAPQPALLALPPGWAVGDAAAILLADRQAAPALLAMLRAGLIAEGTAVMELEPGEAPCPPDPPPVLSAGAAALRQDVGAGLVVAIGFGSAGPAALQAAGGAAARTGFEGGALPLAAAVALAGGPPTFAPGAAPRPEEAWPLRAPILCRLLAGALGEADVTEACLAALLPAAAGARGN